MASALEGLAFGIDKEIAEEEEKLAPKAEEEEHFEPQAEQPAGEEASEGKAEIERKARSMGWKPKDQYRGRAELWVDAEEYVTRGETFMPLLKTQNRKLEGQIETLQSELRAATERLAGAAKSIEELRAESSRATSVATQEQLIDAIAAAKEQGNTREEIRLMAQLGALMAAPQEKKTELSSGERGQPQREPRESPAFVEWKEANEWWETDPVKRNVATAIAQRLASEGEFKGLTQAEALNLMASETEKYLRGGRQVKNGGGQQRVNGTRPSGGGGGERGPAGWDEIPARDRQQGLQHAKKLGLIGKGKTFETEAAWQKDFSRKYHSSGIMRVEIVEE